MTTDISETPAPRVASRRRPARFGRLRHARPPARSGTLWANPDFLHLWAANAIDDVGSHVSVLAIPLVAALTLDASAFEMGLLAAIQRAPYLVLGLLAGVVVDRLPRRSLLLAVNWTRAAALAFVPLAALFGALRLELLFAVSLVTGTCGVIFDAAYVAFLPSIVPRSDLADANGKMETTYGAAQAGGPGLAGLIASWAGAPLAVAFDAVSFAVSALLIGRIHPPPGVTDDSGQASDARTTEPAALDARARLRRVRREIGEGIAVVRRQPLLRATTLCGGTTAFFGYAFLAVYILYMTGPLGLGPATIGLILAAGGAGGVLGAIVATPLMRRFGIGPTMIWAQVTFAVTGATVPVAVYVPAFAVAMLALSEFLQYGAFATYNVGQVTVRQSVVPDHLMGRVSATVRTFTGGAIPLGSLLGGILGSLIGLGPTLVFGVAGMALACLWVVASPLRHLRDLDDVAGTGGTVYDAPANDANPEPGEPSARLSQE